MEQIDMTEKLRVLVVEDSEMDTDLIIRHLEKASYQVEFERIDSADEMKAALQDREWDLVISDFNLPTFDALSALALLQASGDDIPFIVVSGTIGEETAVSLMKAGAHDYLMKDHLARLVPAIKRELAEAEVRRQHRLSQEALQESQTRYRVLFDQSPFGVLLLDPETTRPIDFNYRAHTQLGYTREEFALLPLSAYEVDDSRSHTFQKAKDSDGEWNEYTATHRSKTGELRSVDVTVRKMTLGGAQVLHYVYDDVTERKQIEASYHSSEQRFETLTDLLPVGVYSTNQDGNLVYTNKKWLEMAGMTPGQAEGDGWVTAVHPEDREKVSENWRKVIESHSVWDIDFRFETPAGKISWVHGLASELFDNEGHHTGYIGANIDITERKQAEEVIRESEEKFRRVFENSGIAISLAGLDGHFFNCNSAVTRILGYTPEEYNRLTISSISHPDDARKNEIYFQELLEGKRDSFSMEKRNRHKDGHYVWGQLTGSLVRDVNNKPLFSLGLFEDITERKATEEALRESKEHYQSLFTNMMNGFAYCQMLYENKKPVDFIYLEVNEAFANLSGLQNVTGKKASEAIPGFAETDKELLEIYSRVALTGKPEIFEYYVHALDDWYSISVYCPKKEYFVAIFDVISTRKRAEESLRKFTFDLEEAYDATLQGWSAALEMRERETAGHSRRVVDLTLELARSFGIKSSELVHIERGALLHDIGKMGIPDSILLKPGPLTDDEWVVMRQHPIYAYRLLSHIPYLLPALDIPYFHHEHWDGNGYPQGLKDKDIPLPARLFAVVDVWDALSSDRPYRPAWTAKAVRTYIENQSGKQFDPEVVRVFLKLVENRLKT
jgi:PAS domain S-box-containing protein